MKHKANDKRHISGSPNAQNERKKAYRKQSGQVSNPGQPSPCNRAARREAKLVAEQLSRPWTEGDQKWDAIDSHILDCEAEDRRRGSDES